MTNLDVKQILPLTIAAVERAGTLLAQEYSRPGGPRGAGDKADIDVEIEDALRAELLHILPCDFWGEKTGHLLTGNPFCWVVDPNDGTSDFLRGLTVRQCRSDCSKLTYRYLAWYMPQSLPGVFRIALPGQKTWIIC